MIRALKFALVSISLCLGLLQGGGRSGQTQVDDANKLNGAYEFVSESVVLTSPEVSKKERTSGGWSGLWLFQNGHFSQTLMKKGIRDGSCELRKLSALGYESSAGVYTVNGNFVELTMSLNLSTQEQGRPLTLEYKFDGDKLILIRRIHESVHSVNEGTETTVLRRLS